MIEQIKSPHSALEKVLEKQTKTIEDQGGKQIKAIEEHGKQLVESKALVKKYDSEEDLQELMNQKHSQKHISCECNVYLMVEHVVQIKNGTTIDVDLSVKI